VDAREDIAGLRAWGEELAAAEASPWQPSCIAHAFGRRPRFDFTMQTWIDLDRVHSPLLQGDLPEEIEQLHDAVDAFKCGPLRVEPEAAREMAEAMLAEINRGFGLILKMQRPAGASATSADGFGSFLPVLTALISQLGLSRADALITPVGQAFALLATHRHNEGWMPTGTPYAQREVAA